MMKRLPDLLHEWLDGELPDEDFREELALDARLRREVRNERQLRVLIGYALAREDPTKRPTSEHINAGDLAAYLDESLAPQRMKAIGSHLVKCECCFRDYMKLYLLDPETIETEPLPAPLFHDVLAKITPEQKPFPGWLGELVLLAKGSIRWIARPSVTEADMVEEADLSEKFDISLDYILDDAAQLHELASMELRAPSEETPKRSRKLEPVQIEMGGLLLTLLQRRERGVRALSIDVTDAGTHAPVADLDIILELDSGEHTRMVTDINGHAYLLVPQGRSRMRIGYRGHFDVVVE